MEGKLVLQPRAHPLDHVLEHMNFAGQFLRAPLGVVGEGLDDLGQARVDLLDLADEDQVGVADRGDLGTDGARLEHPLD